VCRYLRHLVFSRIDTIQACDRQTDGRTLGRTDTQRRHKPRDQSSRGKNLLLSLQAKEHWKSIYDSSGQWRGV